VSSPYAGTATLARLVLRRDRLRLPLWLIGLGGVIAVSAAAVPPLYDTPEEIAGYARTVGASPVNSLMSGQQAGLDTLGGIVANETSQVAQLGICLMVMFLVVRHTRAEEESGRAELLRSTVLGRHAATLASLLHAAAAAVVVGLVTTGSMLAVGLDAVGSWTYGAGLTLLGLCFAAASLVAAQLATSARGALGLTGAAVALAYVVRGIGAVQDSALVWLSPFGWAQRMDAFGRERWWPALLLLAMTAALLGVAGWLTAHRDFGSGVLGARPGPARARPLLGTPVGLALRLQRGLLLGWAGGTALLGLLYGAILPTVPDLVASNPDLADVFGASADAEQALVLAFLQYVHLFMSVLATGYAVAAVLRLRAEEESGRLEGVLATPVRRSSVVGATVLVAAGGVVVVLLGTGAGLALGQGLVDGGWGRSGALVADQLTYAPAVLLVAAAAVSLTSALPRWSVLAWAGVAVVVLQVLLGQALRLPDGVQGLSPFWHLPAVPVEPFDPAPALVQLAVAGGLVGLAVWAFRRRDVASA
jgi:ABC-2 type transport system permease protein